MKEKGEKGEKEKKNKPEKEKSLFALLVKVRRDLKRKNII